MELGHVGSKTRLLGQIIEKPCVHSQPDGSIRGGDNKTPLGGSLPRRSQRPGRKNSLSQRPCVRDQGEPYSN